jgi:hypothetical protein
LIHNLSERVKSSDPKCSPMEISQNAKNGTDHFEFDRVRAATVATNNMRPVATLILRNRATGIEIAEDIQRDRPVTVVAGRFDQHARRQRGDGDEHGRPFCGQRRPFSATTSRAIAKASRKPK